MEGNTNKWKSKRRLSYIVVLVFVAGFALIFMPRFPREFTVKVEMNDAIRPSIGLLTVKCTQEENVIKSIKKYYYKNDAPDAETITLKALPEKPVEVEISAFGDAKETKTLYQKTHTLNFKAGEEYTFYISE